MMCSSNLVSVIIPCFNRASLIPATVYSVYNQTYRPIECILVDDGSQDNTKAVVSKLKKELDNDIFKIIYQYQENAGAPAARNYGIEKSSGDFIQFLDSDDLLYSNKIEKQLAFLLKNPEVDGVYGDWEHGTLEKKELINGLKSDDLVAQFYGGRVIHTLSFLFRKKIVNKIGPWDIKLKRNQEVDFHLRGILAGGNFEYLPQVTGLWREHDGERIVTSNGLLYALQYHEKWINKLESLNKLSPKIKILASEHLFYKAMALPQNYKAEKIKYVKWALNLNPKLKELQSKKFVMFKRFFGIHISLFVWLKYAQINSSLIEK